MQVVIAERCYAALGDISRTRFLHKVVKEAQQVSKTTGANGYDSYSVSQPDARLGLPGRVWACFELLCCTGRGVACALVGHCPPSPPPSGACTLLVEIRVMDSSQRLDSQMQLLQYACLLLPKPARIVFLELERKLGGAGLPAIGLKVWVLLMQ